MELKELLEASEDLSGKKIPSYKEAIKIPNGGAKAMGEYNMQAAYAQLLGNRFKMRPNAIYNWANKHNVHLINLIGRVKPRALASAVVANEPLK